MCLPIQVQRPDVVLATGEYAGHEWIVTHNDLGFRCGYVSVPPRHPWHGKTYEEIDAAVHGGLTFSEPDEPCGKDGPDDAWWVGFDCAHCGDAPDASLPTKHTMRVREYEVVRTQEYVEGQCRWLCAQAMEAARGKE